MIIIIKNRKLLLLTLKISNQSNYYKKYGSIKIDHNQLDYNKTIQKKINSNKNIISSNSKIKINLAHDPTQEIKLNNGVKLILCIFKSQCKLTALEEFIM